MNDDFEIVSNSGKVYKNLRAYHIALGHAVRQALVKFSKEVEEHCRMKIEEFYAEYTPQYYERTYQLINKMQLGELIKFKIQGSFTGNYRMEFELFDYDVLEGFSNPYGFGTYTSFDGTDVRDEMEMFMQEGVIMGHSSLDLYRDIDNYIDKHLDNRVQNIINNF